MAVWNVSVTAPNGNMMSAPIVAESSDDAIAEMEARHGIAPNDPEFTIVAQAKADDGTMERMLRDAEARRLADEYYRMPVTTRRRR